MRIFPTQARGATEPQLTNQLFFWISLHGWLCRPPSLGTVYSTVLPATWSFRERLDCTLAKTDQIMSYPVYLYCNSLWGIYNRGIFDHLIQVQEITGSFDNSWLKLVQKTCRRGLCFKDACRVYYGVREYSSHRDAPASIGVLVKVLDLRGNGLHELNQLNIPTLQHLFLSGTACFLWCQCVYTMPGQTPALQQNWQSSEKS